MENPDLWREKFRQLYACVIIPTYNNAATIKQVITSVAGYTHDVIVVNDGSTDETQSLIASFPFVQCIQYNSNKGKGWALRKGLELATGKGYNFAITIDADGQHFANDLPTFLNRLEQQKKAIIIGARNMDQVSVPGKSSFGNRFSNFWFKIETGISLPDTQSGYRLYPLQLIRGMRFYTRKYEFEIEVIVRSAWKGISIESVPVTVYYPPKEERVSHFRPFRDFARISVLNTVLVLLTFLYIRPRRFLRVFLNREKTKHVIREHLLNNHQPDYVKALSISFGIFMGIIPIWGFQLLVAIFLSIILKLNKALVIVAANISIPPMIPLIVYLSYKTGAFWMGPNAIQLEFSHNITLASIRKNFEQYLVGSITLAVVAGAVLGLMAFLLLKLFKRKSILAG